MCQTKNSLLLGLALTLPLYGCGGGGGGEGGGSTGGSGSSSPSPAAEGGATTLALSDLQIDSENNLTSIYKVDIDVSLPHLAGSQVYISVCDNAGGDINSVDYDKCLLKAALDAGVGNYQLQVPNHCQSLIAVVSVMVPNTDPLVYTLNHNNQAQTTWLIQ